MSKFGWITFGAFVGMFAVLGVFFFGMLQGVLPPSTALVGALAGFVGAGVGSFVAYKIYSRKV